MLNTLRALQAKAGSSQSTASDDAEVHATARPNGRLWLLLVILVSALLCLPFIRTVFVLGDEGVLLHGADRMLRGDRLYADFFEFLPPGGFILTAAWFKLAGISLLSARILAILTIVGIAAFTFLACRQASGNAPLSAFLTLGWVMMSQGLWTQALHHWFTTLFSMICAWAALASLEQPQRSLRWPLIAGAAGGTAGMVTPTRGALAVIAAFTAFLNLRQNRAVTIAYVLAIALVPVGLIAYLVATQTFVAAFDDVILFTATRYASIQPVAFGAGAWPQNFLLKFLFPLAALLTLLVCARDWRVCIRDHRLRVLAAFGLAGFIGCFPRPDIGHIAFAAPLAFPLLAFCVRQLATGWHPAFRWLLIAAVIGLCVPSARSFLWITEGALRGGVIPTPRGGVNFPKPQGAREMLARIEATPPGDTYFFYPHLGLLSFLIAREQVSKYELFVPGYTLPSQYRDACLSVMRHADWLVIDRGWSPATWKLAFPAMQNARPRETMEFERTLDSGFEFVVRYGQFELRRRREGVSDAVCADSEE